MVAARGQADAAMFLQDFGRYDFIGHALPHVKGFELAFGDVFAYVDVPRPGLPVRKGDGNRLGRAVSGRGRGMRDDDVGFARYLCVVFGDFGGGLGRGGFVGLVVESVEGTVEGLLGKGLRAFPGQYGCFAFEFGDGADVHDGRLLAAAGGVAVIGRDQPGVGVGFDG